jgi:predicted SnoaL-like aldol condensation-catalyzing enzyme/ketosteroid isomerase-like protein
MQKTTQQQNIDLVLDAFDTLFNKRDFTKAAEFWSDKYLQHSAHIPPGKDGLFNLVRSAPDTLRYENAHIAANGDFVLLHGRFSGLGTPRSWVVGDIVKMEGGRLAEHWDVIQDEVTASESKSGLPMFGSSFAEAGPQPKPAAMDSSITIEEARRIVGPLYDALNEPGKKDVSALLAKAANPDYRSYSTNEDWLNRDQLAEVFKTMGSIIPDLSWEVKDLQTFGDQIIVRGEATGTPVLEFWGVKPTGKSFKTMAVDVFTVRNGKLSSAYHVENWMTALQQIQA